EEGQEPVVVDQLSSDEVDVEQRLDRRAVYDIDENQATKERYQTQHRVSREGARVEESLQPITRQNSKSRPRRRQRAVVCLVGAFIDGHCCSLAVEVAEAEFLQTWLSRRCLRANPDDSSCGGFGPNVLPQAGRAGGVRSCRRGQFSDVRRRSWRTHSPES